MSHSRLGCPTPWISKAFKETSCPRGCLDNSLSLGCLLPPLDILCPLVKQGGVGCLTRVDIPLKHWMSKRLGYPTLYWMSKHAGYPTVVPDVQACGLSHTCTGCPSLRVIPHCAGCPSLRVIPHCAGCPSLRVIPSCGWTSQCVEYPTDQFFYILAVDRYPQI